MALNRWQYNDSDNLVTTPLNLDEAEDILKNFNKNFTKDESKVEHLLLRVVATCKLVRELRSNMENEIARRSSQNSSSHGNIFFTPEKALEYLSDEQIEIIFDSYRKSQLETLRTAQSKAEADLLVANLAIESLEDLLKELNLDFNIPNNIIEKINLALQNAKDAKNHKPDWSESK
jgi:hypothetical protein